MRDNLFPPSIVAYAEAKQIQTVLKEAKDFQHVDEYIYYLTHKVNNTKHKDGRIYMQITEEGTLFANSVSPFSENFWNNIEPKIKPLIKALVDKRYLPYSSCEGHGLTFRRYVGLAFADEESRQYVANFITGLKIPGVKLKFANSVSNQTIEATNKRSVKFLSKNEPVSIEHNEKEVHNFNIQFHRNYSQYFFLEIIILEAVPDDMSMFKNPIKTIWLYFMKKYYWDKLTKRLVDALNSKEFEKYKF